MERFKSIYMRLPNERNFNFNKIENDDDYEELISKIKMILFTKKGEVMGEVHLGLDLKQYLFKYNLPIEAIKRDFYNQLSYYAQEELKKYTVELSFTPIYNVSLLTYIVQVKINKEIVIYTEL